MPKKTVIMTEEEASMVLSMVAVGSWIWSGVIGRRRDQELWYLYEANHLNNDIDLLVQYITLKKRK